MAIIIDGKKLAAAKELELKRQVDKLKQKGVMPQLAVLVLANDRAGEAYAGLKEAAAARLGIKFKKIVSPQEFEDLNWDRAVHGIMIQRPGYKGEKFEKEWAQLVNTIVPSKDVDGLRDDSPFTQATVRAVENIPLRNGMTLRNGMKGKKVLIVGRGMVGRKLSQRLKAKNISSRDKNLTKEICRADILISCSGREGLIKTVKPGAVVIDVGWPKGDVDFQAVEKIAGAITPVPGGIGPITVVCLLENLIEAVYNS